MWESPCGRWDFVSYDERFLGDTTFYFYICEKKTGKELVYIYNVPPFDMYLSKNFDYLFVQYLGDYQEVYDIATGTHLLRDRGTGSWYKNASEKEQGKGIPWVDNDTGIRVDIFLDNHHAK
jgi:hypothetical protein